MPVTLIDPTKPRTIIVSKDTNPTTVVFRQMTIGDKMRLGSIVDSAQPMRMDIDAICELLVQNVISIEGIDEDITIDVLQRIDDVSLFWEIAGAVIRDARVNADAEVN